ncbi:MAG: hypothetical protein QXD43_03590 [Candidatus Aenigmatarchaeota archaeon]
MKRKYTLENKGIVWPLVGLAIAVIGGIVGVWIAKGNLAAVIVSLVDAIISIILPAIDWVFKTLGAIAANLLNVFVILNPFSVESFAPIVWEMCKNIAYLILIFLGLISGFLFIIGKEDDGRRTLFWAIIVAFLINFSFLLAKEIFYVSWVLIKSLASYFSPEEIIDPTYTHVGTAIYTSLSFMPAKDLSLKLQEAAIQYTTSAEGQEKQYLDKIIGMSSKLAVIMLRIISTMILFAFAFLALGRFLIISLLAGILPLVLVLYATPWMKDYFEKWWRMFLTWSFNLPILMLFTLLGFSLIAYGTGYFSEANQEGVFLSTLEKNKSTIWGIDIFTGELSIYAQAIAVILRFVFIVGYYIAIIVFSMRLGGDFGRWGYLTGQWMWKKIGEGVIWAASTPFKSVVIPKLGSGFLKASEKLAQYSSKPVVGGVFGGLKRISERVGTVLTKPRKEILAIEAENIFKQYSEKNELGILLKEIIKGKHQRLESELMKLLIKEITTEDITKALKDIDVSLIQKIFSEKPYITSILNKSLKGLLTEESEEMLSYQLSTFDMLQTDFQGIENLFRARNFEDKKIANILVNMFNLLSARNKTLLGLNRTFDKQNMKSFEKNEDLYKNIESDDFYKKGVNLRVEKRIEGV